MGFVGFLTFGFNQTACPPAPTSIHGNAVPPGYLIIDGWAYMLADWDGHPSLDGSGNDTNILYPPINGNSMDASFLFPKKISACDNIFIPLQGEQPNYFPCELFNPNNTLPPSVSLFTNRTNCHAGATSTELLNIFATKGVPDKDGTYDKRAKVYYDYNDVNTTSHLMIYNGHVLNLILLKSLPLNYYKVPSGGLVDRILNDMDSFAGKDMTYIIRSNNGSDISWQDEAECLAQTIRVGQIDTISVGCMFSQIVLYISLVVILGVIITKFVLAVIFGWFLSWRLGNFNEEKSYSARMKRQEQIENWTRNINTHGPVTNIPQPTQYTVPHKRTLFFPSTSRFTPVEYGPNRFNFDKQSIPAWKINSSRTDSIISGSSPSYLNVPSHRGSTTSFSGNNNYLTRGVTSFSWDGRSIDSTNMNNFTCSNPPCPFPLSPYVIPKPPLDYMPFNYPLVYTICLVTCYSEGEDGIRTTLDSIAVSDYPKSHTLLLVVCDGLITGSGESRSTPDICIGMMRDLIVPADEVEAQPYIAIADGSKRNNYAKVYAGFYKYNHETVPPDQQQRVPMITIVKCGSPEEADAPKPGNRGKRDSQIILMQFLQKVIFDERMTRMEYEFFNAIWRITGVPADNFELCLMVDADTKLYPDALSRLISAAVKDPEISGLCGETKIANKTKSWVSMIQVFEYYISHHQAKAFESIFGGVTCLPGCFCMYRIKAPKGPNGYWVPILANPDIVEHYSENIVDTLHRKNLLLLGEDRYLTTLMLRTFPNRKMMFIPQAVCKTIVPDTFKVLLSQRRRWINSTIHNLFELLLVNDLCGTFCFSMQFVVFMELVGTLALPAAISFTLYVVIISIIGPPATLPLILLALILGLPAVLIAMTSRKFVYIGWMLIYLVSLPVWNFVLPTYAYWHFDDFSWGDTRKVEGVKKDKGHGDEGGKFDSSIFVMKKWNEYEIERRTKIAYENNMPIPKFAERHLSVDVYKENEIFDDGTIRRYSDISNGTANVPLTQVEHTMNRYFNKGESSTPIRDIHDQVELTYKPVSPADNTNFNIEEVLNSNNNNENEIENHTLGWIQQNANDNNWADPAPHHRYSQFEDEQQLTSPVYKFEKKKMINDICK
ncbi:chitin synthase-domain-containing protein [Cokeromyces recurvatus]|uniref:chitin synthase-domain-containing protein n=1 Tax=Cokeromyces recurvatus TaxID=90255 RepID=UPI00221EC5A7|nr:chitin synthase-domain-containing protein [Cokeromyces recurvatus]KAI7899604.1 chitin synthase-domain-containing protein [Cokeromyces recurvatus]